MHQAQPEKDQKFHHEDAKDTKISVGALGAPFSGSMRRGGIQVLGICESSKNLMDDKSIK